MKTIRTAAFTLIELLVATAVTAIIVGLMVSMVSNLLTTYNRSSGALAAQSQAGFVLDQLATELESAVFRNTNNDDVMFAVDVQENGTGFDWSESGKPTDIDLPAVPGDPTDPSRPIEQDRFGQGGSWLRFFSSAPSLKEDDDSGVRAIGYRIGYEGVTNAADAPQQYMLYRAEVPARDTFETGYDLNDSEYATADYLGSQSGNDILAGNVVDFGVRVFTFNDDRERVMEFPFDGDSTYRAPTDDPYPRAVEIMIRIITPEGERQLELIEDPPSGYEGSLSSADWWDIVVQNSEVFSRVINIPSRPL